MQRSTAVIVTSTN